MISEWIVSILLLLGGVFILIGSIGLVKLPDFFMRLHGPTKATTLGMANILTAAMVYFANTEHGVSVKEVLITIFLLITAPISGYMLIKAAIHHKLKPKDGTKGLDNIED
ncbi:MULTISPECIES: Na+/H+ antiporter subunit G [Pseudoalteromonas]|jgi:multicomponent K+:H+ antiporter subunit G|uniref:Multiple resistance/pH regulation related protein G n=3 Tax=Pseudoalteromonas TaxID=53246 RepID=Q3IJ65_PSET1|nr:MULTISPECIES: Na+/H+ antiporter subunit G [Pseudoalteromonas]ALS32411.1 multicomponent K+:H+ antiporter subunit G [Pseudoalteromonas translucida KMM 520]ASM53412.1 multicomponent K+:H+ antiporter subunit G [Pseudoalteromonas nigrifaciens]MBB1372128.1 Na+/H+ antiporter subunit G [Pseudoalteromonas sp. SR45-4]MBB1404035.1 Na+/H+ antiporter subunit G [Pseudoalteromonas sp. SG44-5]MBE0420338.1 Na+/H+ antiporter subunit G [Pseudoalteromonas nigrifaciens]|tara:strand:- start:9804 stop:10133 length:330 start_codon:yes stop_codon:yes gene_type:complete